MLKPSNKALHFTSVRVDFEVQRLVGRRGG
jgi:hypothetical protein